MKIKKIKYLKPIIIFILTTSCLTTSCIPNLDKTKDNHSNKSDHLVVITDIKRENINKIIKKYTDQTNNKLKTIYTNSNGLKNYLEVNSKKVITSESQSKKESSNAPSINNSLVDIVITKDHSILEKKAHLLKKIKLTSAQPAEGQLTINNKVLTLSGEFLCLISLNTTENKTKYNPNLITINDLNQKKFKNKIGIIDNPIIKNILVKNLINNTTEEQTKHFLRNLKLNQLLPIKNYNQAITMLKNKTVDFIISDQKIIISIIMSADSETKKQFFITPLLYKDKIYSKTLIAFTKESQKTNLIQPFINFLLSNEGTQTITYQLKQIPFLKQNTSIYTPKNNLNIFNKLIPNASFPKSTQNTEISSNENIKKILNNSGWK